MLNETTRRTAKTSVLEVTYEQTGPDAGKPILLLHGFPYDVRQYDRLRAQTATTGRRLIVPYLRGFGPTRYLSDRVPRSGQQAALGRDVIELLDALGIERATLVGYAWGGRAACVAAALWPDRVRALVSIGGYTIQNIEKSALTPQSPEQERQLWYQWYFQTERGLRGLQANRRDLSRLLWETWSPGWHFGEAEFSATAESFENPDFVATVIHSYRHRYAAAAGDPALEEWERQLARKPVIACPTIVLQGESDPVLPASSSEGQEHQFSGRYERRLLSGVGHCPPAERPEAVAKALEDVLAWR